MRWRRTSGTDIEDRRGQGWTGGRALPIGGGLGGGIGLVVFLLVTLLRGGGFDVGPSLDQFPAQPREGASVENGPDPDKNLVDFMDFVVKDVQGSWNEAFARAGRTYEPTKLVLYQQATQTGCGVGSSESGPFYCPADAKMYLDLGFFRALRDRFGAPGDFAQAYVIAHEAGHHVQNLLGIERDVRRERELHPDDANELSVRLELQADCFAGVWGHTAYDERLLESGDLEEGLSAAAAVGDDRIQRESTGSIHPETWTHGSSAQRVKWFRRGFDSGSADDCNTFSGGI
jgi:predicted metalloprotease